MKAYRGIAYVIAGLVLLQAAFIAFGWFDVINDMENGAVYSEDSDFTAGLIGHSINGTLVIPLLTIVLLITSLLTKTIGASKRAGMVFGAVVLQIALGLISFSVPFLGLLHGINAFVVLGAALYAARLAAPAAVPGTAARETTPVV